MADKNNKDDLYEVLKEAGQLYFYIASCISSDNPSTIHSYRRRIAFLKDLLSSVPESEPEDRKWVQNGIDILERELADMERITRVLFLDFDGVLNTDAYQVHLRANGKPGFDDYGPLFDPEAIGNLKRILDAVPDVRIVVESSWKVGGLEHLRRMWKKRNLPGELSDVTPDFCNEELLTIDLSEPDSLMRVEGLGKGGEISAWLKKYGGKDCRYVILDDLPEFSGELASHHIRIGHDLGITRENAMEAISILLEMDIEDFSSGIEMPDLEEGIPEKVTVKELREALEEYARADKEWIELGKMRCLAAKSNAGDHLYRLAKAILRNNGFHTYRDAVIDSMFKDAPSPDPEDYG